MSLMHHISHPAWNASFQQEPPAPVSVHPDVLQNVVPFQNLVLFQTVASFQAKAYIASSCMQCNAMWQNYSCSHSPAVTSSMCGSTKKLLLLVLAGCIYLVLNIPVTRVSDVEKGRGKALSDTHGKSDSGHPVRGPTPHERWNPRTGGY